MLVKSKDSDDYPTKADCVRCKWQWRPGVEHERSIFRESFCQNANLPKNEIFHCLWLWLCKVKIITATTMLGWKAESTAKCYRLFRQMVSQMIDNQEWDEGIQLGGIDDDGKRIIVEVDESKFGKRKYNRGRRVTANWVIGMVERTPQRRCAMVVVHKRDAGVCTEIIQKCVKPGSIIHSDSWGGYNPLNKMGKDYKHYKLNHSKEFVKKHDDGHVCHAQTIEGTWSGAKKEIPVQKRNGADLQDCLFEFMWRRSNAGNLWAAVVKGLSTVRYAIAELLRVDEVDDPWEPTDILVRMEDCEDYDSANTSSTESDEELNDTVGQAVDGVAHSNGAGRGRQQQQQRQQVLPDAVPSAIWHRQRREAEELAARPGVEETPDGVRRII